jgi:hypothetical protein
MCNSMDKTNHNVSKRRRRGGVKAQDGRCDECRDAATTSSAGSRPSVSDYASVTAAGSGRILCVILRCSGGGALSNIIRTHQGPGNKGFAIEATLHVNLLVLEATRQLSLGSHTAGALHTCAALLFSISSFLFLSHTHCYYCFVICLDVLYMTMSLCSAVLPR